VFCGSQRVAAGCEGEVTRVIQGDMYDVTFDTKANCEARQPIGCTVRASQLEDAQC